jgi:hypothetical protein
MGVCQASISLELLSYTGLARSGSRARFQSNTVFGPFTWNCLWLGHANFGKICSYKRDTQLIVRDDSQLDNSIILIDMTQSYLGCGNCEFVLFLRYETQSPSSLSLIEPAR